MSHFIGMGIVWIGLSRTDIGCWRLTLSNYAISSDVQLTLDARYIVSVLSHL